MDLSEEDLRIAVELETEILKGSGLAIWCGCRLLVHTKYPGKPWLLVEACLHLRQSQTRDIHLAWVSYEGLLVRGALLQAAYDAYWLEALNMQLTTMRITTRDGYQIDRDGDVRIP